MTTTLTIPLVSNGDFGKVSVVVALHLQVEDLAFCIARLCDEEFV